VTDTPPEAIAVEPRARRATKSSGAILGFEAKLFQAADKLMAALLPVLPLYQRPIPLIYRSDILGMVANPGYFGPVWNIEDWKWKP